MSNVKIIQSKIMQLEGGAFQTLFDEYLYKRYKFKNIQTLGVQTGTNKPTKGTPDSYVLTESGKYILINYGSVGAQPADKIKSDILSCFNSAKLSLEKDRIEKIICGYCSTNIHIEQYDSIKKMIEGVEIELIGIDTLSHDLALIYPHIAKSQLGISIDTYQFFDIEDFVRAYDANGINSPINCKFMYRSDELNSVSKSLEYNTVTVLTGPSGIGKTRLALEACRKYNDGSRKVYCVRSNGNLLYEDIKYYVDEPGKYLIFFDDANMVVSLDNVLNSLLTLPKEYEIKILLTVRDYAKDNVIDLLSKYSIPEIIEIKRFKDDEVKEILKVDLGIVNSNYLDKITDIANGNIRLAFLAGLRSKDYGYQAIRNAEDIFKNYYGQILKDTELTKNDIVMLFLIAVAGPVKGAENQFYAELKKQYGKEISEDESIRKLYSFELIDWFKNEITKIADQSLGNYILYYVLYEKKWISIVDLIVIAFPRYRHKMIYALNTLIEIFNSDELYKYIKNSIISAWSDAPDEQEDVYLECFYNVDPDKALCDIKKHIDNEEKTVFDLHSFNIEKNKNYHDVKTKYIKILGGFKNTDSLEDAVDLLLLYFAKRPDLVMDFYFTITDRMLFDKYSANAKYRQESILMEKLWDATLRGENYENTILYLHIVKYALNTEISFTEEIRNNKSIRFVNMPINFTEEIAVLRKKIWNTLGVLRSYDEYRPMVNDILLEVHFNGLDEENSIAFFKSDFDSIFSNILCKDKLDFIDAKIIDRYREVGEHIGVTLDKRFFKGSENYEFVLYKMLKGERIVGETIEDEKNYRRDFIGRETQGYELSDYKKLFKTCEFLEGTIEYKKDQWALNIGLDTVFELLENDSEMYIKVISEYFNENAPFMLDGDRQIKYLLDTIGYKNTYELVSHGKYKDQHRWLSLIWKCISIEYITPEVVEDYKNFLIDDFKQDTLIIPSLYMLNIYGERDAALKAIVIKQIVKRPELSCRFLGYIRQEKDIELLLYVFRNDIDTLSKIYINAFSFRDYFDYSGVLFKAIFDIRPQIWNEYIDWIKNKNQRDEYRQIIELIWKCDNWRKCINYAFGVLFEEDKGGLIIRPAKLLFSNSDNTAIMDRKKKWLLDELNENYADIMKCSMLVEVVVTEMPDWKSEYLLAFLKVNKKIEDFKALNLFPMLSSWSGSEVPLLIDKIKFLQSLKAQMKGVDLIEHRNYIDQYCRSIEEYKKKVEVNEYLENEAYA